MSHRFHTFFFLSSCVLGGLLTGCASPDDEILDDGEEVESVAQSVKKAVKAKPPTKHLAKEWTRWAMELPWSTGPINDPTGAQCAAGQDGNEWFLAGTSGGPATRSCTVPEDAALFFPLVNRFCIFPPEYYPDNASIEADLPFFEQYFAESLAATCSLTLKVDGQDVFEGGLAEMVDDLYVEVLNPFELYLNPEDNFTTPFNAGIAGGDMPALASGHFVKLKPLPPGDHVIEFGGAICDGANIDFETSVTYNLHVDGCD